MTQKKTKYDELAKVLILIRHVRNLHEIGPHPIREEAVYAEDALERALGRTEMSKIYKSRAWSGT